ncbi:hypothetical protein GCM10009433_23380 [Psychroflexus lacisalsi]|uniref:Uncharacterized protein n=1 Tax=Psychroflexus lacisalsi TaxID=503928 RepID=A0ABN1KCT8_9FLAO
MSNSASRSGTNPIKLKGLKPLVGQLNANKNPDAKAKSMFFKLNFFFKFTLKLKPSKEILAN